MVEKTLPVLSFDNTKDVRDFIHKNESSLYSGKNEDGEKVAVMLEQCVGLEIITYQNNGWIRETSYNNNGILELDTYKGRWNK